METTTKYSVENNALKTIITTVETRVSESSVDLDFLYNQKAQIEQQKIDQQKSFDLQMETRDNEIKQIEEMIKECIKKGLKTSAQLAEEKAIEDARIAKEDAIRLEKELAKREKEAKKLAEEAEKLAKEEVEKAKDLGVDVVVDGVPV